MPDPNLFDPAWDRQNPDGLLRRAPRGEPFGAAMAADIEIDQRGTSTT